MLYKAYSSDFIFMVATDFFSTMFTCFKSKICASNFNKLNQSNKEQMVFDKPKNRFQLSEMNTYGI